MEITAPCKEVEIVKYQGGTLTYLQDTAAVEKPVEIVFNGASVGVLYASPSQLQELVVGFLVCKGKLHLSTSLEGFELVPTPEGYRALVFGHCAAASIGIIRGEFSLQKLTTENFEQYLKNYGLTGSLICKLMADFIQRSVVFQQTGGVHSAGIGSGQDLLFFCEDVARYNAFNKAVGYLYLEYFNLVQQEEQDKMEETFPALPLPHLNRYLLISGRVSTEMIEEALLGGITLILSKSAPLVGAIEAAKAYKVGLIGFVRGDRFNIYNL